MYICVMMTFAAVFVGSVMSFIHYVTLLWPVNIDALMWHFIICISFCKVYILIMVMILSLAFSSLSVSVCHSRNSVWICFHIMDLCILLKICWIKISKLNVLFFTITWILEDFFSNWQTGLILRLTHLWLILSLIVKNHVRHNRRALLHRKGFVTCENKTLWQRSLTKSLAVLSMTWNYQYR